MNPKFYHLRILTVALLCYLGTDIMAQPTFNNPMPIPPIVSAVDGLIELEITQTTHSFNPSNPSDTVNNLGSWTYNLPGQTNMTLLGPTLKWTTGSPVNIRVINSLPASSTLTSVTTTTTHWHGAELPAQFDGGPHQPIAANGGFWDVDFMNLDSACTMWYHPHLHNQTLPHVSLGLSGMIISEQPSDQIRPTLPRTYGIDDIPVIIQDLGIELDDGEHRIITEKGRRPINIVNGVTNPYVEVPAHMVRLRILNGSVRKGVLFGLSESYDGTTFEEFEVIATDGGYTLEPNTRTQHLMGPGARSEIVLDLRAYSPGDVLYLRNRNDLMPGYIVGSPEPNPQPGGGGNGGGDATAGEAFLEIRIIPDPSFYEPVDSFTPWSIDWDPSLRSTDDVFREREKDLVYMDQIITLAGDTLRGFTIDSTTHEMMVINDTICVDTKEIWTINNLTNVAHPFHIHKIFFRILEIDSIGADGTEYPIDLVERDFNGPKDDVLILPNWRLSFLGSFDDYPSAIDATLSYMYHCHILTHEDAEGGGMMHQFVVTDNPACMPMDLADDDCGGANAVNDLFAGPISEPQTSDTYDHTDYTSMMDPSVESGCFFGDDAYQKTIWYTFTGDGERYQIRAVQFDATSESYSSDTQIAMYSGTCDDLTFEACNDDEDFDNDQFNASLDFQTEEGVEYFFLIDGFDSTAGEFCLEVTQLMTINTTNVTETDIELFPNPVSDRLNIRNIEAEQILFYDATGRIVLQVRQPRNFVDVSQLPSGFYTVVLIQGENRFTSKLVKE